MEQWQDLTVLIVDDEPMLRDTVRFEIEGLGCKILEAGSGSEAKLILQNNRVGLIVSDIRMPDGDGIDLLGYVRRQQPSIPMFLMSGFSDLATWDAYHLGADAFIGKPFEVERLTRFLEQVQRAGATAWDKPPKTVAAVEMSLKSAGSVALGRGGFFVENAGETLRKDAIVRFEINFATDMKATLEGTGIVRWIRTRGNDALTRGCGIEFLTLTDPSALWVREVLADSHPKAYIPRGLATEA